MRRADVPDSKRCSSKGSNRQPVPPAPSDEFQRLRSRSCLDRYGPAVVQPAHEFALQPQLLSSNSDGRPVRSRFEWFVRSRQDISRRCVPRESKQAAKTRLAYLPKCRLLSQTTAPCLPDIACRGSGHEASPEASVAAAASLLSFPWTTANRSICTDRASHTQRCAGSRQRSYA
jgi:hypothetical protein